jgi:photosystem II stability/assembly factor-like uncharacterized protein
LKKLFILFIILGCFPLKVAYSQNGWMWQNPIPLNNDILKIKFYNLKFGMGVGNFGSIIKTTNSGNKWLTLHNSINEDLKNLYIFDSLNIIVIGAGGSIYKTTDSGNNWTKIIVNTNSQLNDILFLNSNVGFIVGEGKVLRTTNNGFNWNIQDTETEINSIYFLNENVGFLAGMFNKIYKTTNGGINWFLLSPNIYGNWYSIIFKNETDGILLGTKILKTIDGGKNWIEIFLNLPPRTYLSYGLLDSNNLLVGSTSSGANPSAFLLKLIDFGDTWKQISTNQIGNITSIIVKNDSNFITLRSSWKNQFYIFETTNNGITWNSQFTGVRSDLNGVDFSSNETGIVVGNYGIILRTSNGGENWSTINSGVDFNLNDVVLFKSGIGYVCGSSSNFLKTTDFGLTWYINSLQEQGIYNSLSFINDSSGIIAGSHTWPAPPFYCFSKILKTTNGGFTWSNENGNIISLCPIYKIFSIDSNNYFMSNYSVYKTTNSGESWLNMFTLGYQIRSLFFQDINTGFFGSSGTGQIFRTTNSGQNWTIHYESDGSSIGTIKFLNENVGWAGGYNYMNSRLLKTVNGGLDWAYQNGITAQTINDVSIIDENTVYAIGTGGMILKTTTGGTTYINSVNASSIPEGFALYQNFPNPFNPSTKIKFDIPKTSLVRLTIYNILGKKVDELVNENLKAGSFQVEWNPIGLSSGIYFYILESENIRISRKMLLLK